MELRHLRYFVAIAEEGSFTRAAERLWVAQPGLSAQIRRLETELGVQLFERHTRGIDLTDAGELFLERARVTLSAAEAASATGRDLETGVVGTVRLGLAGGAQWHRTCDVLERFTRECGGVELTLLEGPGGTLWRDVRAGRLDAMIAPSSFASPDLRRLDLGAEPWVVLVGSSHALAGDGPLDATDLHGEQIAVSAHRDGASFDRAIAELLRELGVTAAMVRGAPGMALQRAVADGAVLALTTAPEALHPAVTVRRLQPARTLSFQLLWRDAAASPALMDFIRLAAASVEHRATALPVLATVA